VLRADCLQEEATSFIRRHLATVPLVVLARVERAWELYSPRSNLDYGAYIWGRPRGMATAALVVFVVLAPLALGGAYVLRRSGVSLLPLVGAVLLATTAAALAFGFTRYRLAAEPAIVVLAAAAVERFGRTAPWRSRRHSTVPELSSS